MEGVKEDGGRFKFKFKFKLKFKKIKPIVTRAKLLDPLDFFQS